MMFVLFRCLRWVWGKFLELFMIPLTVIGIWFGYYSEDIRIWNDISGVKSKPLKIKYLKDFGDYCKRLERRNIINVLSDSTSTNTTQHYHLVVLDRTISTKASTQGYDSLVKTLKEPLNLLKDTVDLKKLVVDNVFKILCDKVGNGDRFLKVNYYDGEKNLKNPQIKTSESSDKQGFFQKIEASHKNTLLKTLDSIPVYKSIPNQRTDIVQMLQGIEEVLVKFKSEIGDNRYTVTIISDFDNENRKTFRFNDVKDLKSIYAANCQLNLINTPTQYEDRSEQSEKVYTTIKEYSEGLVYMTTLKVEDFENTQIQLGEVKAQDFYTSLRAAVTEIKFSKKGVFSYHYYDDPILGEVGKLSLFYSDNTFNDQTRWKIESSIPLNNNKISGVYFNRRDSVRSKFWTNKYEYSDISCDTLDILLNKNYGFMNQSMTLYLDFGNEVVTYPIEYIRRPSKGLINILDLAISVLKWFLFFVIVSHPILISYFLIVRNIENKLTNGIMVYFISNIFWMVSMRDINPNLDLICSISFYGSLLIYLLYFLVRNDSRWKEIKTEL